MGHIHNRCVTKPGQYFTYFSVFLGGCRPKKEGEAARAKFEDRILKQTRRMGGELQEYDVKTGVWRSTLQL